MSQFRKTIVTLVPVTAAVLVLSMFLLVLVSPLLELSHTPLFTFLQTPFGMLLAAVCVLGVLCTGYCVSQYVELFLDPLTPEEEQDPLIREVILHCSFDQAWDRCYRSLHAMGRLWMIAPDRRNMALSAWWMRNWLVHVQISLHRLADTRYRVVITARRYYQVYEKTGSPTTWEHRPGLAAGKDLSLRASIRTLDAIEGALQEEDRRYREMP